MGILFLLFDPYSEKSSYKLIVAHKRNVPIDIPTYPLELDHYLISGLEGKNGNLSKKMGHSCDFLKRNAFGLDLKGRFGVLINDDNNNSNPVLHRGSEILWQFFNQNNLTTGTKNSNKMDYSAMSKYITDLNSLLNSYNQFQPFQIVIGQLGSHYGPGFKNSTSTKINKNKTILHDSGYEDAISSSNDDVTNSANSNYESWRLDYINTQANTREQLSPGNIYAFSSSGKKSTKFYDSDYEANIAKGKDKFAQIIQEYGQHPRHNCKLVKEMLNLMKSDEYPEKCLQDKSSVIAQHISENMDRNVSTQKLTVNKDSLSIISLLVIDNFENVDVIEARQELQGNIGDIWNPTRYSFNLRYGKHL